MRKKRHIAKKGDNFSRRKSRGVDKKKSLLHAISKNKQKERIHRFPPKDSLPDNSLLIKTAIDEAVTSHVCPAFKLLRLKVQHAKTTFLTGRSIRNEQQIEFGMLGNAYQTGVSKACIFQRDLAK